MTSIISGLRSYIASYSELTEGAPLWVDYLRGKLDEYTLIPLAGAVILTRYLDGQTQRTYPFAFRSAESTAEELDRIETLGFFEAFSDWLDSQNSSGTFPVLPTGKRPSEIKAVDQGYLYKTPGSSIGIYQIQCQMTYWQDAP